MDREAAVEIVGYEKPSALASLDDAAQRIRELDQQARTIAVTAKDRMAAALDAAFWCGQWLTFAKSKMSHGQWLPWLDGVGLKQRNANNYMRLSSNQHDRANLLTSSRNLTHAMELAGVRKPEPTRRDDEHKATRLPDTIERIALDFARWKAADFDKRIDTASDALLCAWERELKPMAQAYEQVRARLTE